MRINRILALLLMAVSANVIAAGEMKLRDAHYWYNMPIDGFKTSNFMGVNCDVLQLVMDVNAGYTDIAGADVVSTTSISSTEMVPYPDRITADAAMFSYMFYANQGLKAFEFYDKNATTQGKVGTITAFAYCLSTRENAYIRSYDGNQGWCVYTNGTNGGAIINYKSDYGFTLSRARAAKPCD